MGKAIITFVVAAILFVFLLGVANANVGPFELLLVLALAVVTAVAAYQLRFKRRAGSSDL